MNEKEYIKNRCSKCINRNNIKDLCNIVKTMDGNYRCSNEKVLIELNEYIKTCTGAIRNIGTINNCWFITMLIVRFNQSRFSSKGVNKICLILIMQ